ncbi:MAG: putative colanic acid biosynthesis acetyltransferase [Spartobacteria bacterium]|nr:putative colanic acid biosynthesis acetyltransferase [Spartobacteria bacterium]
MRTDRAACPSSHSAANKLARLAWQLAWLLLFRPSPWFWHAPRRALLRLFGAKVGKKVQIMPSVQIWAPWNLALGEYSTVSHGVDLYAVDRIEIGAHATISQRAFLCTATHEIDHPHMPLKTAPIRIGDGVWICAEAYVHPGVLVGVDAVVGVRAVALHDVPPGQVVGGNPARGLRERKVGHGG